MRLIDELFLYERIDELYCYVLTKNAIAWAWEGLTESYGIDPKEAATNLDRYSGTAPHSLKARDLS